MPKKSSGKNSAKGTPKRGLPGLRNPRKNGGMSDDDSVNGGDTASVMSLSSDRGSYEDGVENGNCVDGDVITDSSRDNLEEKISEWMEGITEKSASFRISCLTNLTNTFSNQFAPDLLMGQKETLRDILEKILKRGQRADQGLAATLLSILALQLGAVELDIATEDYNLLKPTLQTLLLDHTAPLLVRVKCCQAICMGAFLAESSLDDVSNLLNVLEPLFMLNNAAGSKASSDDENSSKGPSKVIRESCGSLGAAAIAGWSLLITLMPAEFLTRKAKKWVDVLKKLLDGSELEVRLNAGEAVALLVEICGFEDSEEESTDEEVELGKRNGNSDRVNMKALIAKLRELSVQSHKYVAKRDRRTQRHNFRDFLHAVEDGDGPDQCIKFGNGEVLDLDSWVKKRQYDAICQVLGSGMNRHLQENPLVRQILELGSPRPASATDPLGDKQAKSERQFQNQLNFKARCKTRAKNRDHRMANLSEF